MEKIEDILKDFYDYPDVDMLTEMPTDTGYNYINSTFCTGLLNWLNCKHAYMIARYSVDDVNLELTSKLDDNDERLKAFFENIEQLYKISDKDWQHTNLGDFCEDDVIITGMAHNNYYIVWLDHDVSDCCIDKISKTHYKSLVEFNNAVMEYFENKLGYKIKTIRQPDGWIKW